MERYLKNNIIKDLSKKMVFVGGPRQVGKTTLAFSVLQTFSSTHDQRYFNWDDIQDRENILQEKLSFNPGMIILDEIHKYKNWRQWVKGLYDKRKDELKILVTGSARLDYYRHGGDSLQGRYHYYRMHPLSFKELSGNSQSTVEALLNYSGFPEPFFAASETEARRWSREYKIRIIREDLRDLEKIQEISQLEKLVIRLPDLVGSPLSLNAVREDLQVSHQTVKRWMDYLERLYAIFRIYPFGAPHIRAVKKEAKHYHYDWTLVKEPGFRFENLIACHLLKWCNYIEDTQGHTMELRYFRDVDKREVDFVIVKDNQPILFVECKLSDKSLSPHLRYLAAKFPQVPACQVYFKGEQDLKTKEGIRICPAHIFLEQFK